MRSITAAFTVAVLTAVPAAAQELTGERRSAPPPTRAKFEVLFGGAPFSCGEGCGGNYSFDAGATAWLLERVGVSARVRGVPRSWGAKWLEPSVRLRGWVGADRSREIDFGIGRGVFGDAGVYHHAYKVELLAGFRTRERVGLKVGGEVLVFHRRPKQSDGSRSVDGGLVFTVLVVVRP